MSQGEAPAKRSSGGGDKLYMGILWLGVLLIAALPAGFIVGAIQQKGKVEPLNGGVLTTGKVIDYQTRHQLHGGITYTPEISFTDQSGQVHLFEAISVSDKPSLGEEVNVSYDPLDPEHANDVSSNQTNWKIFLAIGIVLAIGEVVSLVLLARSRVRRRKAKAAATESLYQRYQT